jgi:hypothetical protein
MIKRRYFYLLLVLLVVSAILIVSKSDSIQKVLVPKKSSPVVQDPLRPPQPIVGGTIRKTETFKTKDSVSDFEDSSIENDDEVTKAWKSKVEKSLFIQGGKELKAVDIKRVDSFIWEHEGISLNVESVVISVTNQKGEERKFRAMIDPLNGKILRTWDHPVVDSMNPRDNQTGFKLDPRYHGK